MSNFNQITLLITHYNRSKSLERLLASFEILNCSFGDIVVSDDGSSIDHLKVLESLKNRYNLRIITTPKNKGLGSNLNKGQDAVRTPYTLYIQEDFEATSLFPERLGDALEFMESDGQLDIIRFWSYNRYPYLEPFEKGFSRMYLKPFALKYHKIYRYADTPHLRRSTFFKKFGRYTEGLPGDRTEYRMCISFIQNNGKGLFYHDCQSLFVHENSSAEPSTMMRVSWKQSNNLFVRILRNLYRQIKYNYDILMPDINVKRVI